MAETPTADATLEVPPEPAPEAPPPVDAAGRRATWALGSLAVFLFGLEALTGLGLLFHYRPTPGTAHADLVELREVSAFGFARDLHHWGAHALVIVVGLHLFRVVMSGAHKPPRHVNWTVGVALLVLTLGLATTGALLPWDERAYWSIATTQPAISVAGAADADGPPAVDGTTLRRYFALHCGLLPVLAAGLICYHLRRARRDGATDDDGATADEGATGD